MPVTRETIRLANGARVTVNRAIDAATRDLVRAWARAWDRLVAEIETAALDVASGELTEAGVAARLRLTARARRALEVARFELERLSAGADIRISGIAEEAMRVGGVTEPRVIESQLPRRASRLVARFDRVPPAVVEAIVTRTTEQITAATVPLGRAAADAMRSALVTGIPLGRSPRETARIMVRNTEGAFNGGLVRALRVARTETMDAFRSGAVASRAVNDRLVQAVEWRAAFDERTCPACLAMTGQWFPPDTWGPEGHVSCRCIFIPVTVPWSSLGFDVEEPPTARVTGRAWFTAQPDQVQRQIMGPARLEALRSGQLSWNDLARRYENPGWRASYQVPPLRELGVIPERVVA